MKLQIPHHKHIPNEILNHIFGYIGKTKLCILMWRVIIIYRHFILGKLGEAETPPSFHQFYFHTYKPSIYQLLFHFVEKQRLPHILPTSYNVAENTRIIQQQYRTHKVCVIYI